MKVFTVGRIIEETIYREAFGRHQSTHKTIGFIYNYEDKHDPEFGRVYRDTHENKTFSYRCYKTEVESVLALLALIEQMVEINDDLPVGYDRIYEGFMDHTIKERPEILI